MRESKKRKKERHRERFFRITLNLLQNKFMSSAVSNYHASRLMRPAFWRGCCFELSRVSTDETSVLEGQRSGAPEER